nr:galectin-6 [Ciona intestinalis]|eukprot:XP_002131573.1 galectin-6 [Ciona intestinalis]
MFRTQRKLNRPAIPLVQLLDFVPRPGMRWIVSGKPKPSSEGFSINFKVGPAEQDDIAFHFNPRFVKRQVARNARTNKAWRSDHEDSTPYFPFEKYKHFQVEITCLADGFEVKVNGESFTKFKHRYDLHRITHLNIDGQVDVDSVEFGYVGNDRSIQEPFLTFHNPMSMFTLPLDRRLTRGSEMIITGRATADKFGFNYHCGPDATYDYAFRFSPEFGAQRVVRNSMVRQKWNPNAEFISSYFPFRQRELFTIRCVCHNDKFSVYVNDVHFCDFTYKVPLYRVSYFEIDGGIDIENVTVQWQPMDDPKVQQENWGKPLY